MQIALVASAVVAFAACTDPSERDGEHDGAAAVAGDTSGGRAPLASGGTAGRGLSGSASSGASGVEASNAAGAQSEEPGGNGGNGGAIDVTDAGDVAGVGDSAGAPTRSGKTALFFLDLGDSRVVSVDVASRKARTLVAAAGRGPDGIAVDVAGGHVFWTNMGVPEADDGFVQRAELDGSDVTTIVARGMTFTPKQLKIDPIGRKLYWSDREGMRVQRANLDGTSLETVVTVATGDAARADLSNYCVGLALDPGGGYLYWTQKGPDNGHVGSIRRAHLTMPVGETAATRSDVEVLFAGLPEPVDLEIDVVGRYLYWTDRGDDTINRAPIEVPTGATAESRSDRQVLVKAVREAIGIALDPARRYVYYTGSAQGRVGRVELDGTNPEDVLTDQGVLTGIAVVDL